MTWPCLGRNRFVDGGVAMARISDLHKKWMKEPKYKKAYDALEEEFALASAVMDVRSRAGLTQGELARKMGTTQPVVARLESGRWSVWRTRPGRGCSSVLSHVRQNGGRADSSGGRRQKAESRRQKAEGRRQKAEGRRQRAEGRRQKAESRRQKAEGRRQKAEGRRQKAESRNQEPVLLRDS